MTKNTKTWRHHAALLTILSGGFALRLYRLGADSLWYDETVSAYLASKSIPSLVAHTARDIHPPGYYVLLHLWTRPAGDSEFALAFFSLVFGMLLIPLTYAVARRLMGRAVGLWAGLLVATSPFNLWYSQEVRMYTLGAALGLMTLWCALKVTNRQTSQSTRCIACYILAGAAGLYALYYFGFLLVTLNMLVIGYLLWSRNNRTLVVWLLAQLGVLALYLPWLPIAFRQATNPPVPAWREILPLPSMLLESWTAVSLGQSVQPGQVWPVLVVTGVVFWLGLNHPIRETARQGVRESGHQEFTKSSGYSLLLVAYAFGPLLLIYLASLITPLYHVRYLFTYAPAFYIVIGAGLARLMRRVRPLAVVAALTLLVGSAFSIHELYTNPRYATDDFRSAVRFIAERWRPGDVVLVNAGYAYTGVLYYYDAPVAGHVHLSDYKPPHVASPQREGPILLSTGSIDGDPKLGWGDPSSDFYATTQSETAAALEQLTQVFPRLWMLRIYDTVSDPEGFVRDWLEANVTPFEDRLFSGEASMRVQGFMSNSQPSPPMRTGVALEGGISLLGWQATPTAPSGGPLDVVLWWSADTSPTTSYAKPATPFAVSLKLWASDQDEADPHLIAQQDEWPVGSRLFTPDWTPGQTVRHPMRLWLPADLAPGQYRLEVEMYDPTSVQPLPRRDGQGYTIPLGPVTVTTGE